MSLLTRALIRLNFHLPDWLFLLLPLSSERLSLFLRPLSATRFALVGFFFPLKLRIVLQAKKGEEEEY